MKNKYYFFNIDFGKKLTGIERSSFKRAILFEKHLNIIPNFITANLNLNLLDNWEHYKKIGWVPKGSNLVNVYNDIMDLDSGRYLKEHSIKKLQFDIKNITETHDRFYKKDNNFNMYVVWKNIEKRRIDYINYFYNGKKFKRDKFNIHGQLAVSQYLNDDSSVFREEIFKPNGLRCITHNFDQHSKIKSIYLYNDNGILIEVFSNQEELLTYWCNLNIKDNSVCIVDKNRTWAKPLSDTRRHKNIKLISVIHNVHLLSPYEDIFSKGLNLNYKNILEGKIFVDACIILTPQQAEDIRERFEPKYELLMIPHANDCEINRVSHNDRLPNKIITLARLDGQKQIDHMINIMELVARVKPDTQLYVYGEGNERGRLQKEIDIKGLGKNVFLAGYTENISKELNSSVLFLSTSKTEGFPLAFLESMSHGVPIISYDIKYGPKAIIKDGFNGLVVEKNNIKNTADKIIHCLNNEILLKNMSKNAYETAENYTMENIAKIWIEELEKI